MIRLDKSKLSKVEHLFILSPAIFTFLVIFNVHDSKFIVSRLIIMLVIYCSFRFGREIVEEFKIKFVFLFFGSLMAAYFFLMQGINEGNSDLPRSITYLLVYFLVVPLRFFSKESFFYLAFLGSFSSGCLALYEFYILKEERIGFLTLNPIPFSYYSAMSTILMLGIFTSFFSIKIDKVKSILLFISLPLSMFAVIVSQTRATYLSLALLGLLWIVRYITRYPTKRNLLLVTIFIFSAPSALWKVEDVKVRVLDAYQQVQNFSIDDYRSSTGARIKLWEAGLYISSNDFLFGHSKSEVSELALDLIGEGLSPSFLKMFLVHPNPNFHNQFIQTMTDSGIIGIVMILLFVFSPVLISMPTKNKSIRCLAFFVTAHTVICLWFDSMFLYNHTIILYSVISIMFYGISQKECLENHQ